MANFTVFVVSICQKEVATSFVYDDVKNPIPSVPNSKASLRPYVKKVMDKIRTEICDMNESSGRDYSYWNLARVVKDDLRAVPIRAYNTISEKGDEDHDRGRNIISHGLFPVVIQLLMWALPTL